MASRSNALASRMRLSVSVFTCYQVEAGGLLDIVLFDQPGNGQVHYRNVRYRAQPILTRSSL
jgi:hypothetical protein